LHPDRERGQAGGLALDLGFGHIGAVALQADDQPARFEHPQRAPHGHPIDAQHLAQGTLGREPVARFQLAGLDLLQQRFGNLNVPGEGGNQSVNRRIENRYVKSFTKEELSGLLVYTIPLSIVVQALPCQLARFAQALGRILP